MAQQTELADFETNQIMTDGGRSFDPDEETVGDDWEGTTIHTSWGYNATNVELAEIVEVSDSGKTVVAQRVTAETEAQSKASEQVGRGGDRFGDTFRLHVRACRDEPIFRGSYPHVDGEKDSGTRRDSFYPLEDDETVHQTPSQYGH